MNRFTNGYRWYNNYSATRLRITCGDHDKRRNWFEDHVYDRAVNDKSKCVDSEVKDTVRCLYVSHVHMCTRTCMYRCRSSHGNYLALFVSFAFTYPYFALSNLIKPLRDETCFVILIFFVILL